jgi:hypothetical protein
MNKIVGVFFSFLSILSSGFGQVYHTIPEDNVFWVEKENVLLVDGCIESTYRCIYTTNQVTIHGNNYTEFRYNSMTAYSSLFPEGECLQTSTISSNNFYAFIRNDSINKKVYLYDTTNSHQEVVLYDFDLAVGDTLNLTSFGSVPLCPEDTFIVNSIDSIDVGGTYRTSYNIHINATVGYDPIHLIEGIGSSMGFAYGIYCPQYVSYSPNTLLICWHNESLFYLNPFTTEDSSYCIPFIGIEENISTADIISPISNYLYYIQNGNHDHIQISCIDMSGKIVISSSYECSDYLDLSKLNVGVYFITATVNGKTIKPYKVMIY